MTKVPVLLFLVAILPALNGLPLLEHSSTPISTNVTKPSDLKVNPLLAGDIQKRENSSPSQNDDDPTEQTLIEETYIEVLLPGVPQLNASVLESLLNSTATNDTSTSTTASPDTSSSTRARSARDTSSEENEDSSREESKKPSNFAVAQGSTITPVLYSAHNSQNVRDTDNKEDSSQSEENSSEERANKPDISTGGLSATLRTEQGSKQ